MYEMSQDESELQKNLPLAEQVSEAQEKLAEKLQSKDW